MLVSDVMHDNLLNMQQPHTQPKKHECLTMLTG